MYLSESKLLISMIDSSEKIIWKIYRSLELV